MGRTIIIVGGLLIALAMIVWLCRWLRKQYSMDQAKKHGWAINGDLNRAQEQELVIQLTAAHHLLTGLVAPSAVLEVDPTYISERHRRQIEAWLARTRQTFNHIQKKERLP